MSTFGNDTKERKFELASAAGGLFCSDIRHGLAHFREVPDLRLSDAGKDASVKKLASSEDQTELRSSSKPNHDPRATDSSHRADAVSACKRSWPGFSST
jgi:hypothetical protein